MSNSFNNRQLVSLNTLILIKHKKYFYVHSLRLDF